MPEAVSCPSAYSRIDLVRLIDGIREHLRSEGSVDQTGVSGQRFLVAKVRKHGIDRDLAGYLTSRVSSHTIANDEDPLAQIEAEAVLI